MILSKVSPPCGGLNHGYDIVTHGLAPEAIDMSPPAGAGESGYVTKIAESARGIFDAVE